MSTPSVPGYEYKIGGGLDSHAPSYVVRQADEEFYAALRARQFCYVFNSRQMGKSSLRNRTAQRLRAEGIACGVVELTQIGSAHLTEAGWYQGIIGRLKSSLGIKFQHRPWWQERDDLPPLQRFVEFIETVLLVELTQPIVLFFDEIDSMFKFEFKDDFFALIRAFSEQRTEQPEYQRLTFALLGVATPSDLIQDKSRTPFNIGRAIALDGFQLPEVQPLLPGLVGNAEQPEEVLKSILDWTGGQPFLVQKLCQLVLGVPDRIGAGGEAAAIAQLVRSRVLENWETQDQPEHLKTIRDRLLAGGEQQSGRRLGLCQQIVQQGDVVADESLEQTELRLTGLVVKRQGKLRIYNRIYAEVFNRFWFDQELGKLRPYGGAIAIWLTSGKQDESRLLRGQALQDARTWAERNSLGDDDRRFLDASQELEKREMQIRLAAQAEQARATAEQAKAQAEQELQAAIAEKRQTDTELLQAKATLAEVKEITQIERRSTEALRQFEIQPVPALVSALEAGQQLQALVQQRAMTKGAKLVNQKLALEDYPSLSPIYSLHQILSTIQTREISAHRGWVYTVSWSGDGQILATGGADGTVKLWSRAGEAIQTLNAQQGSVYTVSWSGDGQTLASGGSDGTIKLWSRTGELVKTLKAQQGSVYTVSWSGDGQPLASGGSDGTIKLWSCTGELVKTLNTQQDWVNSVSWSGDGQTLASGGSDDNVKLWSRTGELLKTLKAQQGRVRGVSWSGDGQTLATGGNDGTIKLWSRTGEALQTLKAYGGTLTSVSWSGDGQTLAMGGFDGAVKRWGSAGEALETLNTHQSYVNSVSWSGDGQILASGGADGIVKLWSRTAEAVKTLNTQQGSVRSVSWSGDGQTLATGGSDGTVKLWGRTGEALETLNTQQGSVRSVSWGGDGQTLATGGSDGTVKLWGRTGEALKTLNTQQGSVNSVSWGGDGQTLATGGSDCTVKLWSRTGEALKTFNAHNSRVSVSWSGDGQTLATCGEDGGEDGTVKLWSRTGEALKTLNAHKDHTPSVSWSGDGQILATGGSDGTVKLWSQAGEALKTFNAHKGWVLSVSWSGDGQTLATLGFDGTVKLWSQAGEALKTLNTQQGAVRSMSWSSDGQTLATGGDDGTVKLWPNEDLDALLVRGCRWAGSYLIGIPQTLQTLTICQTSERLRAAALNLVADSEALARSGNIEASIQGFKTAQQWDSSLVFNPVARAKAAKLQGEAEQLLQANQPDLALTKLREAIALMPDLKIPANTWNSICWKGSINGKAALVLSACNEAVSRNPNDAGIRDSRGLARALTGDRQGAIEDFKAYIQRLGQPQPGSVADRKAQRQRWIDDLRAGKPPSAIFTPEVLEQLRKQ